MTSATVETLTAEVRTLVVSNRQVTLSVYKQLDYASPRDAEIMGRVRATKFKGPHRSNDWHDDSGLEWVGRHRKTGALVRGIVPASWSQAWGHEDEQVRARKAFWDHVQSLDLIVLAGLK